MATFGGGCHCGALRLELTTSKAAAGLTLLACQCAFCRKHATRATADPDGRVTIRVADRAALQRYTFGLRTASYLICRICGVYVGAVVATEAGGRALVNVNCLDDAAAFAGEAKPANYDGESLEARRARRRAGWTPATVVFD
jgi:hypothetical protein